MITAAQRIAKERSRNPGLLDLLRVWAEDKYSLPLTHEAFRELTVFELSIWFWEDYYRRYPLEAKRVGAGDHVQFHSDDPLIDKWERELAQGIPPDLTEGMSPEQRKKERKALERLRNKHSKIKQSKELAGDGFSDDYSFEADAALSKLPILGRGTNASR